MTPEEMLEAKKWFIDRFLPTIPARRFALRNTGLVPEAKPIQARVRRGNTRFDFSFVDLTGKVLIVPRTNEAGWVMGVLFKPGEGAGVRYLAIGEEAFTAEIEAVREALEN